MIIPGTSVVVKIDPGIGLTKSQTLNPQTPVEVGRTPIAHFAHIGGAITGFIMMWYWKKNQFNNKRWN